MRARASRHGRSCLLVAPGGADPISDGLAAAGFRVASVGGEREALEFLDGAGADLAAAYVSDALGASAVSRLIAAVGQRAGTAPVVVLGTAGTVREAVDAMQLGAEDYLVPPWSGVEAVKRLARVLERPAPVPRDRFPAGFLGVVGSSPAMRRLYDAMDKVSRYKTNVLLLGESGTGKEIIARALHERGPRRQHLFVPVNCATLGREILENELFGHERGAFTGANERKKGLFELADGGTFFLDEIAEMDISTQAKLLRVLERSEFRRVGGTGKVRVDLSIVAATNRDLEAAIAAGRFREDLYYRLKVVTLVVPPLRERREDIPALVDAFIADFNRRTGGGIARVGPGVLKALMDRDWPGNVRELRNAVEGACVLASGDVVTLADFEDLRPRHPLRRAVGAPGPEPPSAARREDRAGPVAAAAGTILALPADCTLADAERRIVVAALRRHGTRARAARALGIGLRTLYSKLASWREDGAGDDADSA